MKSVIAALFLTALGISYGLAQSQPPAPAPLKAAEKEKRDASQPKQSSSDNPSLSAQAGDQNKSQSTADDDRKSARIWGMDPNCIIAIFTVVLACVGGVQAYIYAKQAGIMREALEGATAQSKALERHIQEAARLADAAEKSAEAGARAADVVDKRTAQQMRAYISVVIGGAIYQDANNRFEAKPLLVNNGHTPAYRVTYHARAEIREIPLPTDFDFPLPNHPKVGSVVGPQQNGTINAIVDNRVDDALVADIKTGSKIGLVVWGIVNYEDVFGEPHYTKFSQNLIWLGDGKVMGYYIPGHNDAT